MLILSTEEYELELASIKASTSMILANTKAKIIEEEVIIEETPKIVELEPGIMDLLTSGSPDPNSIDDSYLDQTILESHTYDKCRKPHGPNIPHAVKAIVGALGTSEKYDSVQEAFNISKDTIGNLVNNHHLNDEVKDKKDSILAKIQDESLKKIDTCIGFLEISAKMPNKELLHTAESLSRIHKNVTPAGEPPSTNAQFIFYVPESQKSFNDYETVVGLDK